MIRIGLALLVVFFIREDVGATSVESGTCIQGEFTKGGYWWHAEESIMGTEVKVELWQPNETAACEAIGAVLAEMHRVDELMSPYIPLSQLSILNRDGAKSFVKVGDELFNLIVTSRGFSILTGGAFDITYASAGRHYEYRTGKKPDSETLAEAQKAINYRHLALDYRNKAVRFDYDGVSIDLGGIAKGHAVDAAILALEERGIKQAMVSAGGDSRIIGDRLGEPWVVAIRHPRVRGEMSAVLPLMDVSVSTSGDYERFFEEAGTRYHHIIDPVTGDSARRVASVTIIGKDATTTDALSTSVFVLGVEEGLQLINRMGGLDAIIIDGQGLMHLSDSLITAQVAQGGPS